MLYKSSLKLIVVTTIIIVTLQSCWIFSPYPSVNIKKSAYYHVVNNDTTKLSYDSIYSITEHIEPAELYMHGEQPLYFKWNVTYLMFYKPNVVWGDFGTTSYEELPETKTVPSYELVAEKRNGYRIGCYKIVGDSIFFDTKIGHHSFWRQYSGKIYADSLVLRGGTDDSNEQWRVTYIKDSVNVIFFDDHKNK